jgi:hypothetical protein
MPAASHRTGPRLRLLARALALVVAGAALGGCSSFDFFKAKEEIRARYAGRQAVQRGLYLLNDKKDYKERGQEVRGGRPPAPVFDGRARR